MQTVSHPTIEQLVAVAQSLPPQQLSEVLDFALFVQGKVAKVDAAWDKTFATRTDDVAAWVDRVMAEDGDEATEIDDSGEVLAPASAPASAPRQ